MLLKNTVKNFIAGFFLILNCSRGFGFEYHLEGSHSHKFASGCGSDFEIINPTLYDSDPMDQGDFGTCYAHSVAQIYNAIHDRVFGSQRVLSPLIIGLNSATRGYKSASFSAAKFSKKLKYLTPIFGWEIYLLDKKSKEKDFVKLVSGGRFYRTFKDLRLPVCDYGIIEDFLSPAGDYQDVKEMLSLVYDYTDLFLSQKSFLGLRKDDPGIIEQLRKRGHQTDRHIIMRLELLHSFLSNGGAKKHVLNGKPYVKRTVTKFLHQLCGAKKLPKIKTGRKVKVYTYRNPKSASMIRTLAEHFSQKNPLPVEFGYCVNKLTGEQDDSCGYHSSVIYGKKCQNNQLYFLVRNSWGGKSLRYQRQSSDRPDHRKLSVRKKIKGDYWIRQDLLQTTWNKKYGDLNLVYLK